MERTIFTKMAGTGQQVEVRVRDYDTGPFLVILTDGKQIAQTDRLAELSTPRGDVTHYVREPFGKTAVGFRKNEAEIIEAAYEQARKDWQQTPEGSARKLRSEREMLSLSLSGLFDDAEADFEREWDRGEESRAYAAKAAYDERIAQAQVALQRFDEEHPEVLAAIKAEKAAAAERFERYN